MNRPSFQFYPADWLTNVKLRRCSIAARGAWIDILCALHDSDEYGVVRWPLAELAQVAGVPLKLARELASRDVLKGADVGPVLYSHTPHHAGKASDPIVLVNGNGPIWFSSRFVRDEWRRGVSGGKTRFSSEHQPDKGSPSGTPSRRHGERQGGDLGNGASTSSSTSSSVVAVAGQEDANQIARLNRILAFSETDFRNHASNTRTLVNLKKEGCDFEQHILPAAEQAAKSGKAKSLAYIAPRARELRDAKALVASMPKAFENTDERGWRDRVRVFRDKGLWSPNWGPKPEETGCKCPAPLLSQEAAA